jgi:hypothetical protein
MANGAQCDVPNASPYTVNVRKDANRPGRYRWDVYETTKLRDSSMFSFATKREAQKDAELFIGSSLRLGGKAIDNSPKPHAI